MSLRVYVNEQTLGVRCSEQEALAALLELHRCLSRLITLRPKSCVRWPVPLVGQLATESMTIGTLLARTTGKRDLLRWLKRLADTKHTPTTASTVAPFRFRGQEAVGLTRAALEDGLAVSLVLGEHPHDAELVLERPSTSATPGERLVVWHACDATTVGQIQGLADLGRTSVVSGEDLWSRRLELYDHIEFLPDVEKQLLHTSMTLEHVSAAHNELRALDRSAAAWDVEVRPAPVWQTKVTPESSTRLKRGRCCFTDLDGSRQAFALHGRFTPGAGRIHFRLAPQRERRLTVAWVGKKLGE